MFYLLEDGYETETIDTTVWNGTNPDTDSKYNLIHYTTGIARGYAAIPYRGAYYGVIDLALGGNDAYTESTNIAVNPGGQIWARFYLAVDDDVVMAVGDTLTLLEIQSAGPITEGMVGLRMTATGLQVYAAEEQAALLASTRGCALRSGWHCIELGMAIDTGANNGVLLLFVDGYQVGANLTGLTQAAITQVHMGVVGIAAGTTAGTIFLDEVVLHGSRIYGHPARYPEDIIMTRSGCVIPGPGWVESWTLMGGSASNDRLRLYDRDTTTPTAWMANSLLGPELVTTVAFETTDQYTGRLHFRHGLWCDLAGSEPRAHLSLGLGRLSEGLIRNYAQKRPGPNVF